MLNLSWITELETLKPHCPAFTRYLHKDLFKFYQCTIDQGHLLFDVITLIKNNGAGAGDSLNKKMYHFCLIQFTDSIFIMSFQMPSVECEGRIFLWILLTHLTQIVSAEPSWDNNHYFAHFLQNLTISKYDKGLSSKPSGNCIVAPNLCFLS